MALKNKCFSIYINFFITTIYNIINTFYNYDKWFKHAYKGMEYNYFGDINKIHLIN